MTEEIISNSLRDDGRLISYHPDHLGTSTVISNSAGAVHQYFFNLPFGETMIEGCTNTSYELNYKFNAKELDAESGMYYYGARYYDPRISVWMSVDPMAKKYPNYSAYNYCINNPLKLIDPNGQSPKRPKEAKNVRNARKEAKRVGVEPSIWEGKDDKIWASVEYHGKYNPKEGPYSKVFKPKSKSLREVYHDKIGKYVADGSNDLCNSGGTTPEGWKGAILICGTIASAGSLFEAAGFSSIVITSVGLLNSIDDLGENEKGEGIIEQNLASQEAKNLVKVTKNTVSLLNVTTSTWKINETIQSPFQTGSSIFDLKTLIENEYKGK